MISWRGLSRVHRFCFAAAVAALIVPALSFGQPAERTHHADRGFYLGLTAALTGMGGDNFDGIRAATIDYSEAIIAPDIDPNAGLRALFGLRLGSAWPTVDWGMEFDAQWSNHDGTYLGIMKTDVTIVTAGLNAKAWFLTDDRAQPYLHAGFLYWASVNIDDGSVTMFAVNDATLAGYGFEFGAGVNLSLLPQLAMVAGGNLRPIIFTQGKGVRDDFDDLDYNGSGFGWDIYLGLTVTIPVASFND